MPATGTRKETAETIGREMVITRWIGAPKKLVYEAFTSPEHLPNWMGPRGFRVSTLVIDVRPGGEWKFTMHGPDGRDYPNRIVWNELHPYDFVTYAHAGDDPKDPVHFTTRVDFTEEEGGTRVKFRSTFPSAEAVEMVVREYGALEGGRETIERLEEEVVRMLSEPFVASRTVDATRELAFRAHTECEHLRQWFGPKGFRMHHCAIDARRGGSFHYGQRNAEGFEVWGKMNYREVTSPSRIVAVMHFSDANGGVTHHPMTATWPLQILTVTDFSENDGRTTITVRWSAFEATEEERSMFAASFGSMEQGVGGTLEQLVEYLARARP